MTASKTFCVIFWMHRFTNEQGYQAVCCSATGPDNLLRDAEGALLHVSRRLTDEAVLNAPALRAVRAEMLQGKWPAMCERCRRSEEAGAVSTRTHLNQRFGRWESEVLAQTTPDGSLSEARVRYADIRLGNTCNLTCRMCNPSASARWVKHYNQVQAIGKRLPVADLAALEESNWVKRQPVESLIEQSLPSVEGLHFAGGEPLIIPEMLDALELCIRAGRSAEIDLSYNTNITVLPNRVKRLWPHFRSISLICSVDGFGKLNEYIRRPSKWDDIDKNLRLLEQNFDEWKLRYVFCNTTVQVYNVLQLGDLFDYLAENFRRVAPAPLLTPLYEPPYLSIAILPPRLKDIARERLSNERAKLAALGRQDLDAICSSIDTTMEYLSDDSSGKHLMDFLYFSEKSDRVFGDSWKQACQELARLLPATE